MKSGDDQAIRYAVDYIVLISASCNSGEPNNRFVPSKPQIFGIAGNAP